MWFTEDEMRAQRESSLRDALDDCREVVRGVQRNEHQYWTSHMVDQPCIADCGCPACRFWQALPEWLREE